MRTFVHGEMFEDVWEDVGAPADIAIKGRELRLFGLSIYSLAGARARLGPAKLRKWLSRVKGEAKAQGFARLLLEFDRLTGANPRGGRIRGFDL